MNTMTAVNENPRPMSFAWLRKAFELVRADIVPCPSCEQPMLKHQRCGSCGHTSRVTAREAQSVL